MSRTRVLAACCAAVILVGWLAGALHTAAAPTPYSDPKGRFSLTVPDGWRKAKSDTFDAAFEPSGPTEAAFAILVGNAGEGRLGSKEIDPQDVQDALGDLFDDVGPVTAEPLTLSGQPAQRFTGSGMVDDTKIRFTMGLLVTNDYAYLLLFVADAADYEISAKAASLFFDSFTIGTGPTSPTPPRPITTPATTAPTTAAPTPTTPGGIARRLGDG